MSDIFVKTANSGQTGWRKATNLWIKTTNAGQTGWRAISNIWLRTSSQWLRVWPVSGIFATRVPWISYFSSDTYSQRMPNATYPTIRIGTSYFGNNAQWDLNGWTASSYQYAWKLYNASGTYLGSILRSGTGSGWTSGGTGQDTLPTSVWTAANSTTFDRGYLGFEVTAVNSSNTQYNGVSVSTPTILVVRERPVNISASLSTNSPTIGTAITYSSTWQSGEAYKEESARTTIFWYKNSTSTTTGGTLIGTGSSYTPTTNNTTYGTGSDVGFFIYATETRYNSGTDYDLGTSTGVSVSRVTTSAVGVSPNAFTYSITDISSVTTPSNPTQQRVSSTSNTILVEIASSQPSDTSSYELWVYGSGSATGGTLANPAVQTITTLNQYDSNGNISGSGTWDTITNISSSASNSPISTYSRSIGTTRSIRANVSTTTNAQSWAINFSWSNASTSSNVTYYSNGVSFTSSLASSTVTVYTDTMPVKIIDITGANNPTVTINNVTAYSGIGQSGAQTAGTAGSPTSIASITRPSAFSGTTTNNYTFYTNNQAAGSQRRVNLPSNFTSGTIVYISTNGYIGIGTDPSTSIFPPASGAFLMPLQGDQRQTALWTYSDASNFYVRWQGARYNDAAQTIDYQAKFYWNSTAVDVYFVTNNLATANPASTTAVYNNGAETVNWSASTSQASTLISTASMTRNTTQDTVDDNRTAITASLPVSPPVNTVAPSVTPSSGTQGVTLFSTTDGTWTNSPTSYSYQWRYLDQGTLWLAAPASATSPFTNSASTYTPPSNYVSLYGSGLRCYVTATNSGGDTTANSSTVTVTAGGGSPPATPTGVTNTYNGGTSYTFSWTASTGATSYDVFYGENTTAPSPNPPASIVGNVTTNTVNTTSTSYNYTSSSSANYVGFQVRANNSNGSSSYSAVTLYR